MKIVYEDNKKTLDFGYCKVVEESNNFYGIYREDIYSGRILLTHTGTWRKATKIATLLKEAYDSGKLVGYEDYKDLNNIEEWLLNAEVRDFDATSTNVWGDCHLEIDSEIKIN